MPQLDDRRLPSGPALQGGNTGQRMKDYDNAITQKDCVLSRIMARPVKSTLTKSK